jgi:hypothetical protein
VAPDAVSVLDCPTQIKEADEVTLTVGVLLLVIATVDEEAGQAPFDMVHWNTLTPEPRPLTVEIGEMELEIVAAPDTSVQTPVPTAGVLPANVPLVAHKVCDGPAFEALGVASLLIATVDEEAGHKPLEMVHWKTLTPILKAVMPDVGDEGDVIIPLPETKLQAPVPITGVLPAKVAVVAHTVCDTPAFEIVGGELRIIATVELDVPQLLEMVHWKTLVPVLIPVTPEAGEVGLVMAPLPDTNVQLPVPTAGVFPAKVAVEVQIVCEEPAVAAVGSGLTYKV